ncbi:MAG: hypothetical protein JWP86_460 [Phenylobacterium sp.]|nr:hypothetical protein [Phenylobacterium sp.]
MSAIALATAAWGQAAYAETSDDLAARLGQLQKQVEQQAEHATEQDRIVADQQLQLKLQGQELENLRRLSDALLQATRGTGVPGSGAPAPITIAQAAPLLGSPPNSVGEAPAAAPRVEVASVPEGLGVLTPRGHWVVEPSTAYTHGSSNRLVFRGIEIVTGLQIGVIEANDADRNAAEANIDVRYGLLDRLELEARVPYLYRDDRVTTLAQREASATRTMFLRGYGPGDIELSGRYQINSGLGGWPVFIAGVRVKTDTGISPFEVDRDQFGVAQELATGSGFWGAEASLTFLYPSDPVVIFGGISYFDHMLKHIDRDVGGVIVGKVDPGDSIGANLGFGFALNPRFSFSLGYKHNYIYPTKSVLGGTVQRSESLQVGAFMFGWSFAVTDRITISNNYEIGTTRDSPDMRVMIRIPVRF